MKYFILTIIIVLFPIIGFSQTSVFEEEKVDEMTGSFLRTTDYIQLKYGGLSSNSYFCRLQQIDENIYFEFKLLTHKFRSIDKDASLILKFSDNSVMTLKNDYYVESKIVEIPDIKVFLLFPHFQLTKEELATIVNKDVIKLRVYLNDLSTGGAYIETEIKSKKADLLIHYSSQLYIKMFPSN